MQHSFGWDLSSYGTDSNASLCHVSSAGNKVVASVLRCKEVCTPKLSGLAALNDTVEAERSLLELCCGFSRLFVDVPIDLTPLADIADRTTDFNAVYNWQLVRRPVDKVFHALPPLADRIGYAVSRLANLLSGLSDETPVKIDDTLFETYPAGSLQLIEKRHHGLHRLALKYRWRKSLERKGTKSWPDPLRECFAIHAGIDIDKKEHSKQALVEQVFAALSEDGEVGSVDPAFRNAVHDVFETESTTITRRDTLPYKSGKAKWSDGRWSADGSSLKDTCLAELMTELQFSSSERSLTLCDDDFDAVMCAVLGCRSEGQNTEPELEQLVKDALEAQHGGAESVDASLPRGYCLLNDWPKDMHIDVSVFECEKYKNLEAHVRHQLQHEQQR